MVLSVGSFLLLAACLGLLAGFLGGLGGRRAALWGLRGELAVLASQVDPKLRERMAEVSAEVDELSGRMEAASSLVQSVKGDLGAIKKASQRQPMGEGELEFITAAVAERLTRKVATKVAG